MWYCVFKGEFGRRMDKQPYKSREDAEHYIMSLMEVEEIPDYEIVYLK